MHAFICIYTNTRSEYFLSIIDANTPLSCKVGFFVLLCKAAGEMWVIAVTGSTMPYRNTTGFCLLQKYDPLRMQNEPGLPN